MSNPLDPIIDWLEVVSDSLRVTSRVLERGIKSAVTDKHRSFFGKLTSESLDQIATAKGEVDDLVVLALVATFERTLRDWVAGRPRVASPPADPIDEAVCRGLIRDLEYWRLADQILFVFESRVAANLIGQVKQVIEYRNWVAHGRSVASPPSTNVVPQFAYRTLSQFLKDAGAI